MPRLHVSNAAVDHWHGYNAVVLPGLRGKVMSIAQNLVHALTPDELAGVIAHEYAHIVLGHVPAMSWLNSLLQISLLLPARVLYWLLYPLFRFLHCERNAADICSVLLLVLQAGLLLLFVNAISRRFEQQADALAVEFSSGKALLSALQSLNARFRDTGDGFGDAGSSSRLPRLQRLAHFFQSHPSVQSRIELLQAKETI